MRAHQEAKSPGPEPWDDLDFWTVSYNWTLEDFEDILPLHLLRSQTLERFLHGPTVGYEETVSP